MINQKEQHVEKFIRGYLTRGETEAGRFFLDDPTILGFNIHFDFSGIPSTFPYEASSPLFNDNPAFGNSAINYLKSIEEPERANNLIEFRERLRKLTLESPHFFQKMSGLEEFYRFDPSTPFRMSEKMITITTLESLDLRVATMMDRYMKAVYDFEFHRRLIPENLCEFTMTIMVYEIRNFKTWTGNVYGEGKYPEMEALDYNINLHKYTFQHCNFDFSNSNPFLDELSNAGLESAENKFSIKLGRVVESHNLRFSEIFESGDLQIPESIAGVPPVNLQPSFSGLESRDLLGGSADIELGGFLGGFLEVLTAGAGNRISTAKELFEREAELLKSRFSIDAFAGRAANELLNIFDARVRSLFASSNIYEKYRRFTSTDLFDNLLSYIEDTKSGKKPTSTRFPDTIDVPKLEFTSKDLGTVPVAKISFNRTALGTVAGFQNTPISSLLNNIAAGALGTISSQGDI